MDDLLLQKIAISGPTLASMIQRFSSSPADVDGLLFGHVTYIAPSTLSDDSQSPSDSQLVATISSFLSFPSLLSFYDSLGQVDSSRLTPTHLNHKPFIGWFSSRRKTPLRPSMRESSVSRSLSCIPNLSLPIENANFNSLFAPSIFLLFTTPVQDQSIQTNQYRAFQLQSSKRCFNPVSMDIVNIGPAFRGHYGSFRPSSSLPFLNCELRSLTPMNEDRNEGKLIGMKQTTKDQSQLDMCTEGMQIGRLSRLIGPEAVSYTSGLEDLYEKMLSKIESLARLVEASSAKVLEQEVKVQSW
ncbi:BRCA1-A complex subunit Abraxas 1-like isoform X2 [Durio zibethinus]|uniref:BRCA1-A complex subunit Abraxas 1-like isoform X2 n=1 Tax=Durio zibethinus TaxID=66656 RepID=A0A6P5Z6T2_DURZI|nr:BRCA1-A complex subunit Abraxas 1-like isoform X2 [Durio zibethinus]XP_022748425.1 BRCA1-A complex subunit Abraxas 1-like isoform X2 [Durio zibethinus]XP_022748426.1 BRCA1-A complex subunit Abraxas 1-like isoform X2 [Durio zibethinus]